MKCCICGKDITGYGHNPYPVKKEDQCCDECNKLIIMKRLQKRTCTNLFLDALDMTCRVRNVRFGTHELDTTLTVNIIHGEKK